MFERFTKHARHVVAEALETADGLVHEQVDSGHLLLALAGEQDSVAGRALGEAGVTADRIRDQVVATAHGVPLGEDDEEALRTLGIDLSAIRERAEAAFGAGALDHRRRCGGRIPFSRDAKKSLELALREAVRLGDRFIGTEHLLLGVLRAEGAGDDVLRGLDVDVAALRRSLESGKAA